MRFAIVIIPPIKGVITMDSEKIEMLNWVNAELEIYAETLEQVKAHIAELEMLKTEIKNPEQ